MKKNNWINFLHFYQPPYQDVKLLKIIVRESYNFLLSFLNKHQEMRFTVNFCGSLTELLEQNGHHKIIEGFRELALRGQVELVGTAKYHPILPLLPEEEIKRQIELNDKINKAFFGNAYNPKGFFCPEMAYDKKTGKIIKQMGFEWVILDEIAYNGKLGEVDYNKKYKEKETGLAVIFRNRKISKSFPPETIYKKRANFDSPIITATDAEMYGHYHKDPKKFLTKIANAEEIETLLISAFLKRLKKSEEFSAITSSWESEENDIKNKRPFIFWNNPDNKIHGSLWQLAKLVWSANKKYNSKSQDEWARKHLNRGIASCTWWWTSEQKADVFSPWSWNPDEIGKGVEELIKSVRSLKGAPTEIKIKAERLAKNIMSDVWEKHWLINEQKNEGGK